MILRASGATATLHTTRGAFSPLSLILVLHAAIAVGDRTKSTRTASTELQNTDATPRLVDDHSMLRRPSGDYASIGRLS